MKKDTLEFIELLAKGAKAYVASMADGKIDLQDAAQLLQVWPAILPAVSGIAEVPGELSALTPEERDTLNAKIREAIDFTGTNAELEAFLEDLLVLVNAGFAVVKSARALFIK